MNNFKMLSNFIKNKEKKENEDSVRNKKINLRPLDHILNIREKRDELDRGLIYMLLVLYLLLLSPFLLNLILNVILEIINFIL